jgi:hypothetical protein
MFLLSIKLTIKKRRKFNRIAVKKENRVLALFYVVAIQFRDLFVIDPEQSNQSTFGGKNKTIFHKAENTVTFDGEIIIT